MQYLNQYKQSNQQPNPKSDSSVLRRKCDGKRYGNDKKCYAQEIQNAAEIDAHQQLWSRRQIHGRSQWLLRTLGHFSYCHSRDVIPKHHSIRG